MYFLILLREDSGQDLIEYALAAAMIALAAVAAMSALATNISNAFQCGRQQAEQRRGLRPGLQLLEAGISLGQAFEENQQERRAEVITVAQSDPPGSIAPAPEMVADSRNLSGNAGDLRFPPR